MYGRGGLVLCTFFVSPVMNSGILNDKYAKASSSLKYYLRANDQGAFMANSVMHTLPSTRFENGKLLLDISTYGNTEAILRELIALGLTHSAHM